MRSNGGVLGEDAVNKYDVSRILLLVCKGLHEQQKVELFRLFFVRCHTGDSFIDSVNISES